MLDGCPITDKENYTNEIFEVIPSLEVVDYRDRDGKVILEEEKSEELLSEGEELSESNIESEVSEESVKEKSSQSEQESEKTPQPNKVPEISNLQSFPSMSNIPQSFDSAIMKLNSQDLGTKPFDEFEFSNNEPFLNGHLFNDNNEEHYKSDDEGMIFV